ncbi:putative ABC transport system ATP-binding protein [Fictibacillus solisalsi]|uniref:Putative ABC transport system ATP-binding protein n=1 Tax=Fictibacillus solisalsi TaxID=459525 RepID=A0A1G9XS74_9BACL|nr:ATP-binding cassette domain-containing protein [Fictibacillus solisalsi]SDM99657.1 putative ABC transport system ATP-binding protein [Fictibacillus solisalsi]
MFELKDIRYKDILKIGHLRIEENKVSILTGESGSGKTTVLKLLNHLISPDEGTVLYKGKDIASLDPVQHRRNVIMLQQMPAIFPGTVRDNLIAGLMFSEKPVPDDRVLEEALHSVYLRKSLETVAEGLSGGEQQRLALARVLLLDSDVYLLDEPSSALDDETADEVISSFLKKAKQKNKTVIMVTHSKQIADRYAEVPVHLEKYNQKIKEAAHEG